MCVKGAGGAEGWAAAPLLNWSGFFTPPLPAQAAKLPMSIIIVGVGQAEFDGRAGGGVVPGATPPKGGSGGAGGACGCWEIGDEFVGAQRDSPQASWGGGIEPHPTPPAPGCAWGGVGWMQGAPPPHTIQQRSHIKAPPVITSNEPAPCQGWGGAGVGFGGLKGTPHGVGGDDPHLHPPHSHGGAGRG